MSEKLKAVFDTQIFLRALINRGSVNARIASPEFRNYFVLCISDAIEAEIKDVLNRPGIRAKFPQITDELVQGTLSDLRHARRIVVDEVEEVPVTPKTMFSSPVLKWLVLIISSVRIMTCWCLSNIVAQRLLMRLHFSMS